MIGVVVLAALQGISLDVDPCVDVATPFVERVVGAELAGVTTRPSSVHVTCEGDAIVIAVESNGSKKSRSLHLELEAREARPRLLGLAIAEVLESAWSEPPPAPVVTPAPKPVPVVEKPVAPPRREEEPKRWEIAGSAVSRGFRALPMFGGELALSYRPGLFGARLATDATTTRVSTELGDVDVLGSSVALAALLSTRGFESSVGYRLGLVRLAGTPRAGATGHSLTTSWGGPFVSIGARVSLSRAFVVFAAAEGGWATLEAAGLVSDEPRVALEKAWWSARVGLAFSF